MRTAHAVQQPMRQAYGSSKPLSSASQSTYLRVTATPFDYNPLSLLMSLSSPQIATGLVRMQELITGGTNAISTEQLPVLGQKQSQLSMRVSSCSRQIARVLGYEARS